MFHIVFLNLVLCFNIGVYLYRELKKIVSVNGIDVMNLKGVMSW